MRITPAVFAAAAAVFAQPFGWDIVQMRPAVMSSDLCFLADGRQGRVVVSGGACGRTVRELVVSGRTATWDGADRDGNRQPAGVCFCALSDPDRRTEIRLVRRQDRRNSCRKRRKTNSGW